MRRIPRREFIAAGLAGGAYALLSRTLPIIRAAEVGATASDEKLNVLFFAVDDLRPEIGCYGVPVIQTPNIDRIAAGGTVLNRAYCQQAVCSPSRTSLLCGLRPDTTKVYDLQTHFRLNLPDVVTLPQYFKQHGYHTQGFSKIYHGGLDDPKSWSVPHWRPSKPGYGKPETLAAMAEMRKKLQAEGTVQQRGQLVKDPKTGLVLKRPRTVGRARGPSWEDPDVPDNALPDGQTADEAVKCLQQIQDKPFFLAVGFLKPHLPFVAPKKYYDLYPPSKLSLADNPFPPKDCPQIALTNFGELRNYIDINKEGPVPDDKALELIRGYFAAASYTDAQIGRVLDELDRLGLRDKTVIVLWGDHGWQLGEHGLWCKHTNFEVATRSPLLFSAPGQKSPGANTDALAEFVDIYPTLCELCGLPIPEGLEGISLAPVMDEPDRPWKRAVFSQYPRGKNMGYTMRTDRYRYTEWLDAERKQIAVELYDHEKDPDENVNIALRPENKELVKKLSGMLHGGWREALPPGHGSGQ